MTTHHRTCEHCGTDFVAGRAHARFCSAKCRVYWNREHPTPVTRNEPVGQPSVESPPVTRDGGDREAWVRALLEALRADLGPDWAPGPRLEAWAAGDMPYLLSTHSHLKSERLESRSLNLVASGYIRAAELRARQAEIGERGGKWVHLGDAGDAIWWAVHDAYVVATDEYDSARRRAEEAKHDNTAGDPTPAKGTRDALLRFAELANAVISRDPESFARRVRRAERGQASDEVRAALEAAERLAGWAAEVGEQLDELGW